MTKHLAIIIRSLRVASKLSYATIAELISLGQNPDYHYGQKLCENARKEFPEDTEEMWQEVDLSEDTANSILYDLNLKDTLTVKWKFNGSEWIYDFDISNTFISENVFPVQNSDCLLEITVADDGTMTVTNGVDGFGNNIKEPLKNAIVTVK